MYRSAKDVVPGTASLPAAAPAMLHQLFQHSHSFLAIVSGPDRVFEYVNAEYLARSGRAELTGLRVCEALPELAGQNLLEELEEVFRTGEPLVASERPVMIRTADGELERRYASYVCQPLRDDDGDVTRVAFHGLDVTDHVVAREALNARETFYRSLLENSQDKITAFRPDGTVLYESPAIERLLGWTPAEVIGTNVLDLVHPEDVAVATRAVQALARGSTGSRLVELRLKHRNGSWRTFEVIGKLHSSGEGAQIITNCRDVTERRAADRALRERDALFRTLVELIPQLVWSTTPEGYHDYFNQKWYEYTGMPSTGDQGWNWSDYLHPDDREHTFEAWNLSLTTGQPYDVEYRFRHRDGEYRWFMGRALPLRDETGCIVRWFGTCTDVHDERMARDAARESQERFECATRATSDVIWDWNLDTDELWNNENLRTVFGIPVAADMGHISGWQRRIHPEDRERVCTRLYAAIADGAELWTDEYRFMCGDGSWAHVLDRGLLIRDAERRPVRMVGSMSDMTRRMQLEEELRQAQKLEAIGRLAGGVAHDFNNLLTVITSYTEILLVDLEDDNASRADVDEIRKAANRAASLTRQLLAFSRRQVLQPRDIDLNEIVADVEKMLRRIIGETVRLVTVPCLPLNVVRADPGQIEQIIMNLVVNARDALPSGGTITVRTENRYLGEADADRRGVPAGDYVAFTVEDDGLGMEPAVLARAFEPFFTTKASGRGTGLGLATVHGIVQQSGGSVSIESEPGLGTRVQIMLPAVGSAPIRARDAAAPLPAGETRGGTVLLVEDEEAVRRITVRSLKRFGYDVLEADNGADALRLLDENGAIDLVLTDLVMPQMTGRELAAQLRERTAAPPVLFMSGYSEEDVIGDGLADRGTAILEKPFTVQQLGAAVAKAISTAALSVSSASRA